jgi:hypothetical protein
MENSIKKLGNQNFNNICTELEDNLFQTVRNQLIKNNLEVIEEELGEMVNDVLRAVYYQE